MGRGWAINVANTPPKKRCQNPPRPAVNLVDPSPDAVDFWNDVALGLAKSGRYAGQLLPAYGPYSIAQHAIVGADWLHRNRRAWAHIAPAVAAVDAAAAFLHHDDHESYINDWPTPAVAAAAEVARREFQKPSGYQGDHVVKSAVKTLKFNLDRAIYTAAGIAWPLPAELRRLVAWTDLGMLNAERRVLLAPPPEGWGEAIDAVPPLPVARKDLIPWSWDRVVDEYRTRLRRWSPSAVPVF